MACSTCRQTPTPVPVPKPHVPQPCPDGEQCVEVISTDCVVYPGDTLPGFGLEQGMTLSQILKVLSAYLNSPGAQSGVHLASTSSIRLTGTGTLADPYKMRAIVAAIQENILKSTPAGLQVVLTKDIIKNILIQIKNDPDLQTLFCQVCPQQEEPLVCQALALQLLGSPAQAAMGYFSQQVQWGAPVPVSTQVDKLPVSVESVAKNQPGAAWQSVAVVGKKDTSYTYATLLTNLVYQLKVVNVCEEQNELYTSSASSNVVETAFLVPPALLTLTPTSSTMQVEFIHVGGDVNLYSVEINGAGTTQKATVLASATSGKLSYTFSGLLPATSYTITVISRVDQSYVSLPVQAYGTTLDEACKPPTNLQVVIN